MIERKCPICGSPIQILEPAPHMRLLCKKCHSPCHLSKAGTVEVGEPPDVEVELEAIKQQVRQKVDQTLKKVPPARRIVPGVVTAVVLGLVLLWLLRPSEPLAQAAEKAAKAVADRDLRYLKSIAAADTGDDVTLWFDALQLRLAQERERWHGRPEVIEVHVGKEDRAERKGNAVASIHPAPSSGRDVSLANPAEATASADVSVDIDTAWTLSQWGHWRLDGRETYAKTHPSR